MCAANAVRALCARVASCVTGTVDLLQATGTGTGTGTVQYATRGFH